jgi:SMI1-KNR4 cell-wall
MPKVVWSQLPQRLELLVREGETIERPRPKELDAALDDYEARAEFRLPLSYREFIHWFGPGALSSWFLLAAPIPERFRGRVGDVLDIDKKREMIQDPEGYWATSCDPDKLERLVLFASTEGGDWFFWDTADVRSASRREYGIYGHAHENSGAKVALIAPSFKAFVMDVCLAPVYPFSNNERREVQWSHYPAWPSKPGKRDKQA